MCSSSGWSILHRKGVTISHRVVSSLLSLCWLWALHGQLALSSVLECQALAENWPSSSCIHQWTMHRALYSFLHQLVGAPVPTWRLGLLVVRQSFVVLPLLLLMTTITAMLNGALFTFLSHSLLHKQGRHLQSVQLLYVACYPTCFSISDAYLSMNPIVLAPYLHGRIPRLLLYGHRDVYVLLLLGQQRCVQV